MNPKVAKLITVPNGIVLTSLVAGGVRALVKGLAERPEWSYYRRLAELPLAESLGPDKSMFGYFPGVSTLFKPLFAAPEPLGLIVLILLNVVSCVYVVRFVRHYASAAVAGEASLRANLTALACAGPIFLAIQNSQIIAPAVALSLYGYRYMVLTQFRGAALLAFACLLKTLPLALMGLSVLKGRWKEVAYSGVILVLLTFTLAVIGHGVQASWDAHLLLPEAIGAQEPALLITEGVRPRTIDANLSLAAVLIMSRDYIGDDAALFLRRAMFWVSLVPTLIVCLRHRRDGSQTVRSYGMWMAWTVMAAPFGRYYYLLFLVPAWTMIIDHYVRPGQRSWRNYALIALILSPLLARNAVANATISTVTYVFALLVMLAQEVKAVPAPDVVAPDEA